MSASDDLQARVRELAQGSPYAVTPTEDGFDVGIDIVDAQWYDLFQKEGLSKTFAFHVKLSESDKTLTVTDDEYTMDWQAGVDGRQVPRLRRSMNRQLGTVHEIEMNKVFAWDEKGKFGEVVNYTFSTKEGHELIKTAYTEQGWTKKVNAATKVGLWFAAGGIGIALIAIIVVVLLLVL